MRRRLNLSRRLRNTRTGQRSTSSLLVGIMAFLLILLLVCLRLLIYILSSGSSEQLPPPTTITTLPSPAPQLHVENNLLLDSHEHVVRLTGANRSGTEYRCLNSSVFDGPNSETSIDAMLSWHINAIRVPLNEDCWLGINVKNTRFGGDPYYYQKHIRSYVEMLISNGITPILDLHWSAPGTQTADQQQPMPDRDHSVEFWHEVAQAYQGNNAIIFDLFNEPFPDQNHDTLAAWRCWRYGTNATYCPSNTAGLHYEAAGMQELVNAVRNTGASNVILLGGIQYAATLDDWMQYKPVDPLNQLAASWHLYNFSYCNQPSCWSSQGPPLMQAYPVITGEIGENDQQGSFIVNLMSFLDNPGDGLGPQSYLAWVWNTDQTSFDLIENYSGKPTSVYGKTYMDHLLALHTVPVPRQPGRSGSDRYFPPLFADRRAAPVYTL